MRLTICYKTVSMIYGFERGSIIGVHISECNRDYIYDIVMVYVRYS